MQTTIKRFDVYDFIRDKNYQNYYYPEDLFQFYVFFLEIRLLTAKEWQKENVLRVTQYLSFVNTPQKYT